MSDICWCHFCSIHDACNFAKPIGDYWDKVYFYTWSFIVARAFQKRIFPNGIWWVSLNMQLIIELLSNNENFLLVPMSLQTYVTVNYQYESRLSTPYIHIHDYALLGWGFLGDFSEMLLESELCYWLHSRRIFSKNFFIVKALIAVLHFTFWLFFIKAIFEERYF